MADKRTRQSSGRFSTLAKYFRNYRGYLLFGALSVIGTNVLLLGIPYISKIVFDALEQRRPSEEILRWVAIGFGLAIVAGIFRFMMRRTIIWMSRRLEYDMRRDIFAHLLTLTPSYFHQTRTGDIMNRLTSDLEAVRMMIGPGIMHIANTIVSSTVAIALMFTLSPKLTFYAVLPMIFFPLAVNRLGNLIHRFHIRIQEQFSTLTASVQENLAGVRVVKAYRQEEAESTSKRELFDTYRALNMDMVKLQAVFFPTLMFLAGALNLTVFFFGGLKVLSGEISLGTMVAFFAYLNMLFWPLFALGWVISLYQRGTASLDRINEMLSTLPEVGATPGGFAGTVRGKIEFRNLQFAYFADRPVLRNLTLTIGAGERVGIIGPTASGKTTLVSLIARLYPTNRGELFVDGVDVNDWNLASLRAGIGFATQEPFLFSDTIFENMRLGKEEATRDEVHRVSEAAALAKDVDGFPLGLDTIIGERGITLSGGQRQRTAIARAALTDPAILILDDATSAVDTETEHEIWTRMQGITHNCTAIIISHRVSSVKEADQIIYLEAGSVAEQGDHDTLMRLGGKYAALYHAQLLQEELERL